MNLKNTGDFTQYDSGYDTPYMTAESGEYDSRSSQNNRQRKTQSIVCSVN